MKFAATALLLGCAVTVSTVALQSKSVDNHLAGLPILPDVRLEMARLWHPLSPIINGARTAGRDAIALLPQAPPAATTPHVDLPKADMMKFIHAAALRHNVPAAFVKSIVAVESNFNCNAVSPRGAIGLMQLMPETAQEYGADPTDPEQNIDAGTHYLRVLMNRYQNKGSQLNRVIAAYNAGPGMVDKYRGIPPFRETRNYVTRVLGFLRRFRLADRHSGSNG
jgi:soluble lytic murein transglycosylase-like protein